MKKILTILGIIVYVMNFAQTFTVMYAFSNTSPTSGTTDPTPPPTATGVTFGSFSAIGVSANSNASGRFSFTNWTLGATNGSNTFTGGLDTGDYYEVTITPVTGYTVDLNSITFTMLRSATGIRQYAVRSSIDGYTANISASINPANPNLSVVPTNIFQVTDAPAVAGSAQDGSRITLGGTDFTGLTSAVTFRFYAFNAEDAIGSFSIDNLIINGTATAIATPDCTTFISPTNNDEVPAGNVTFSWNAVTGATGYKLKITSGGNDIYNNTVVGTTHVEPLAAGIYSASIIPINGSEEAEGCESSDITFTVATPTNNQGIVINEIYGGGGNSGATLKSDFIELYNAGNTAKTLTDAYIQYGTDTSTGALGSKFALPSTIIIPAGGYYLIKAADGSGGTQNLPNPDFTIPVNISATAGKIALTTDNSDVTSAIDSNVIDFVGFGTTTNMYEGTGPAPAPSNTTSTSRTNGIDTNDNATDFTAGTPTPTNSNSETLGISTANASKIVLVKNTLVKNEIVFGTKADVKIYNAAGQLVKTARISENESLDVSSLRTGIYVVEGNVNGQSVSQKIIKN
ncbi:MAG: lamin tail domain-containing protein [Flavobacteriaceae bacterium]|jgi:hypothetical protein|nr:lamin tail domain-containing protein [Flavobacteriaceae bacterium]